MTSIQREHCKLLRSLSSEAAAAWMIKTFPMDSKTAGEAFILLPHRSWASADQLYLARYYLRHLPYVSARPYDAFAAFMSIPALIRIIADFATPLSQVDEDLLGYYLFPVLSRNAKTEKDLALIGEFQSRIGYQTSLPAR